MEGRLLLWVYAISALYTLAVLRRQRAGVARRFLFVLGFVGAVSAAGLLEPRLESPSLWAGSALFLVFLLLPGLLVRAARALAVRGRFGAAGILTGLAAGLVSAPALKKERDLYRTVARAGGTAHPRADEIRRRLAPPGPARRPVAGPALLMPVLAVSVAALVLGGSRSILTLMMLGANHGPLVLGGDVYRLFTATFVHIGLLHLALNAAAVLLFAGWLEPSIGTARTVLVFLLAGIAGNVASFLVYGGQNLVSAGASGGAMGLVGAALILSAADRANPRARHRFTSLVLVVGATLVLGALEAGIDNGAHGGGLAIGLALGLLFRRAPRRPGLAVRAATLLLVAATAASFVWLALAAPAWIRPVPRQGPGYRFSAPAFLVGERDGDRMLYRGTPVGEVEVERVGSDGNAGLADRISRVVDSAAELDPRPDVTVEGPAPVPGRPGWTRAAVTLEVEHGADRTEVYLYDREGGRALVTVTLPHPDEPLHRAVVDPILGTFRVE